MHRANPRAGEHGKCSFWNHWHINCDAVAFLDAPRFHHIGKAADIKMQLFIGERDTIAGAVAFPDDGRLIAPRFKMPVEAVFRYI